MGVQGPSKAHRCLECCGWLSTGLEVRRLAALGDLDPTQQKAESSRPSLLGPCRGKPPSLRRARWLSGPTPPLGHVSNPFMLLFVPWHCLQNIQGPHPSSGPQTRDRTPSPFSFSPSWLPPPLVPPQRPCCVVPPVHPRDTVPSGLQSWFIFLKDEQGLVHSSAREGGSVFGPAECLSSPRGD